MDMIRYGLVILIGYLLGAIPSGLIAGKLFRGVDLREYGSGKTGATNALRTLGVAPAVLVVLADFTKGIAAVLIARALTGSPAAESLTGLAAAVGHNWPVYAGFRGGRGVLVSYGIFWLICWPGGAVSLAIGVALIAVSRYVSLGVLIGTSFGALLSVLFVRFDGYSPWILLYALPAATLIVLRHLDNIERLRAGTERKLGQPAKPAG